MDAESLRLRLYTQALPTCCCVVLQALPKDPKQLADVLHLAFNCRETIAAWSALELLPYSPHHQLALELLTTALIRHPASTLIAHMLERLPTLQQLTAAELVPLLQQAVQSDAGRPPVGRQLGHLCGIPAFSQLPAPDLAGLLQAAIAAGDPVSVDELFKCPAAAWLSGDGLAAVLQAAMQQWDEASIKALGERCSEGLEDMPESVRLPLLQAAIKGNQPYTVSVLWKVWADNISTPALARLLQAALETEGSLACFWPLYGHPSVAELSREAMLSLLKAALQARQNVELLWGHPAVRHFSAYMLADLLGAALQHSCSIATFCLHPAAAAIRASSLVQLLGTAVAAHDDQSISILLTRPSAADISPKDLVRLLHQLISVRSRGWNPAAGQGGNTNGSNAADLLAQQLSAPWAQDSGLSALCCCPAAAAISAEGTLQLMQAAVKTGDTACVAILLQQKAALITSAMLAQPLQLAVARQHVHGQPSTSLANATLRCALTRLTPESYPESHNLSQPAREQLLQTAAEHGRGECGSGVDAGGVYQSRTLAGTEGISSELLVQLLTAAVHYRDASLVCALVCCPAAAAISKEVTQDLLLSAMGGQEFRWRPGHGAAVGPWGLFTAAAGTALQGHWKWPELATGTAVLPAHSAAGQSPAPEVQSRRQFAAAQQSGAVLQEPAEGALPGALEL